MSDFQAVNETFKSYFTPDTYSARSLCQVVKMLKNGRVEIDVVAIARSLGAGFIPEQDAKPRPNNDFPLLSLCRLFAAARSSSVDAHQRCCVHHLQPVLRLL
ncbi:hypothetical protein niasHT_038463 [Heterodera trifolii]|uniref:Uncharacterized protein n=1 Tax=Heterodera trifolii TaxID=157864 RepID=A0ABD2IW43_9BILA